MVRETLSHHVRLSPGSLQTMLRRLPTLPGTYITRTSSSALINHSSTSHAWANGRNAINYALSELLRKDLSTASPSDQLALSIALSSYLPVNASPPPDQRTHGPPTPWKSLCSK